MEPTSATNLSHDDVQHIARLARLTLTDAEVQTFQTELNEVLGMAAALDKVDTLDLPETAQVTGQVNCVRPDEADVPMPLADALANAPMSDDHNFIVPSVL